jgi:hypothetical protein
MMARFDPRSGSNECARMHARAGVDPALERLLRIEQMTDLRIGEPRVLHDHEPAAIVGMAREVVADEDGASAARQQRADIAQVTEDADIVGACGLERRYVVNGSGIVPRCQRLGAHKRSDLAQGERPRAMEKANIRHT